MPDNEEEVGPGAEEAKATKQTEDTKEAEGAPEVSAKPTAPAKKAAVTEQDLLNNAAMMNGYASQRKSDIPAYWFERSAFANTMNGIAKELAESTSSAKGELDQITAKLATLQEHAKNYARGLLTGNPDNQEQISKNKTNLDAGLKRELF